jgi:dTDP-glucose 4,6-dehydratase
VTFQERRILVTGGLGFLGSHFVRHWLAHGGGELVNLDALTYAGSASRLPAVSEDSRYRFVQADVRDRVAVREVIGSFRPDVVVHFAAESHVTRSETEPDRFWDTNVEGTRVMLEEAATGGCSRFIHVSTDEVYGPTLHGTFREEDKLAGDGQTTSSYAKSKAIADDLAREFEAGPEVIVIRPTNCFGPWQYPEKAFARWVTRALSGQPVPLWGDGLYVRQWLYAEDLAEAISLLLAAPRTDRVYNIGPRHRPEITNLDLARWLMEYLGLQESHIVFTAYDRPDHDRRYAIDPSRIEALGWNPRPVWNALIQTVEWYRRHEDWWGPLVSEAESIYSDHEGR